MTFEILPVRFIFRARDSLFFPAGKPGNVVRGAFGIAFRAIACKPDCRDARTCGVRAACPYARTFEPAASGAGPSGLSDWPRPFVFRVSHLDGRVVKRRESFHFDVHLFDLKEETLKYFALAFERLAHDGLGPRRGRAELIDIRRPSGPVPISLEGQHRDVHSVRVHFVTPTELKAGEGLVERPEFGPLFARIRDRISTLRALYGAGPLEIDFRAIAERATAVTLASCELQQVAAERKSTRTGQQHSLGGFAGWAQYQGALDEFLPYLEAARWTGVGRHTVWGNGEIRMEHRRAEAANGASAV